MRITPAPLLVLLISSLALAQATQPSSSYTFDVRGLVTDRAGKPIPDAEVDVFTGGRNYEPPRPFIKLGHTVADAEGRFILKGVRKLSEDAPHIVRAIAPGMGYGYASGPIMDIQTGQSQKFGLHDGTDQAWIVLRPAETIRGRVIDEEDRPVAGAQIESEVPIDDVRTNENGEFTVERCMPYVDDLDRSKRSTRRLIVRHPDFVVDAFGQAENRDDVVLRVRHGVLITGRLTELDNNSPMPDSGVAASTGEGQRLGYFVRCDSNARYQLRIPKSIDLVDLHPFLESANGAQREFAATERSHRITVDQDDPQQVDFTFKRRAEPAPKTAPATKPVYTPPSWAPEKLEGITGKVVDEHGQPVRLARVEVIDLVTPADVGARVWKKSIHDRTTTDMAGNFRCAQVDPAQPLAIIAWDSTYQHMCQIVTEPATKSVELRLTERSARLSGTMRDENGQPLAGLPITLTYSRGSGPKVIYQLVSAVTDAQGHYEIVGYHAPPEGLGVFLSIESSGLDWSDGPERAIAHQAVQYVYFPVKPGETLAGLDYQLVQRSERLPIPTREEFTREP